MTWEYRVMERDGELAIYEVYYDDDGGVQGYTENVAFPAGDTLEALRANCQLYVAALAKPILKYD
jgi:hypothetical protein